jgi:hypothetical protein
MEMAQVAQARCRCAAEMVPPTASSRPRIVSKRRGSRSAKHGDVKHWRKPTRWRTTPTGRIGVGGEPKSSGSRKTGTASLPGSRGTGTCSYIREMGKKLWAFAVDSGATAPPCSGSSRLRYRSSSRLQRRSMWKCWALARDFLRMGAGSDHIVDLRRLRAHPRQNLAGRSQGNLAIVLRFGWTDHHSRTAENNFRE